MGELACHKISLNHHSWSQGPATGVISFEVSLFLGYFLLVGSSFYIVDFRGLYVLSF